MGLSALSCLTAVFSGEGFLARGFVVKVFVTATPLLAGDITDAEAHFCSPSHVSLTCPVLFGGTKHPLLTNFLTSLWSMTLLSSSSCIPSSRCCDEVQASKISSFTNARSTLHSAKISEDVGQRARKPRTAGESCKGTEANPSAGESSMTLPVASSAAPEAVRPASSCPSSRCAGRRSGSSAAVSEPTSSRGGRRDDRESLKSML